MKRPHGQNRTETAPGSRQQDANKAKDGPWSFNSRIFGSQSRARSFGSGGVYCDAVRGDKDVGLKSVPPAVAGGSINGRLSVGPSATAGGTDSGLVPHKISCALNVMIVAMTKEKNIRISTNGSITMLPQGCRKFM